MSEAEVDAHNLREARREVMGRLVVVGEELGRIGGNLDDVVVYEPVGAEVFAALRRAEEAVERFRLMLVARGYR